MDFLRGIFNAICSTDAQEDEDLPEIELPEHLADIREQMEFYFSDANLDGDVYMKNSIAEREDRYVPVQNFLKFNRIQKMSATVEDILNACEASRTLEVDRKHELVRSRKPFVPDPRRQYRTVSIRGFDRTETLDTLKVYFRKNVGKVNKILMKKSTAKGTGDKYFSGMVDVELPTEEAAQKLVEEGLSYEGKRLKAILLPDLKKGAQSTPRKSPRRS